MSKRNYKLFLQDIWEAVENIELYTGNISFAEFSGNKMIIDAVIRNFEIIGEASKNIPEEIRVCNKKLPWKEMAGMRDKMIHEYFGVDLDIVWETINKRLPEVKTLVKEVLEKMNKEFAG